jgi:Amt family ammonium transporter
MLASKLFFGKADITMALNGALAGLVSITAEPLSGTNIESMLIGAVGGVIVVASITFLDKIKIDDPVGAISVHGTCGIWGLLAVLITSADATLVGQLTGLGAIFGFTFVASLIVWLIIKVTMGIRISEDEETLGSDMTDIGVEAYPEFTR